MSVDVRYFGVAPHWYFRPTWVDWLLPIPLLRFNYFNFIFCGDFFQPTIVRPNEFKEYSGAKLLIARLWWRSERLTKKVVKVMPFIAEQNFFYQITFCCFLNFVYDMRSHTFYLMDDSLTDYGNNVSLMVYDFTCFSICAAQI